MKAAAFVVVVLALLPIAVTGLVAGLVYHTVRAGPRGAWGYCRAVADVLRTWRRELLPTNKGR